MTDYNSMSHQQLYDYVFSGSPSNVESEATLNQNHGKSVSDATSDLQKTLTNIQGAWSGAAADEFTQQANSIVQQMQIHAEGADTVHTWMNYASQYLTWAQSNMPSPPSSAEQALADVNKNSVSEWGIGILTGGTSYLASNAAQEDIAKKKAAAVSVMTQLASAYGTANENLAPLIFDGGTDTGGGDEPPPVSTTKGSQSSSGSSSGSSGSNASAAGMVLPMTMAMQGAAGGYSGGNSGDSGDSGVTSRVPTGSSYTSGSGSSSSSTSGSTGTPSSGVTDSKLPTTVTSGLGDLPTTGTTTGSSGYTGLGTTTGGGGSSSGLGGLGGLGAGGLSEFGGSGAAGLGSGGLGAEGEGGSYGSTGLSTSSGKSAALSGGTGTGELGEEAGGTGYGSQSGAGSGTAAAAAGEAEGTGSTGQSGMMGGMGGMGHGGGGGQEERGNRASWLKEDPDYWYSDKMKNAAPPGGVIE